MRQGHGHNTSPGRGGSTFKLIGNVKEGGNMKKVPEVKLTKEAGAHYNEFYPSEERENMVILDVKKILPVPLDFLLPKCC